MGEELIKEEALELEEIEADVDIQDSESDIETEETVDVVEIESSTDEDIVVEEMAGWVGGDSSKHYSLAGRDEQNQHPIGAITGLRAELDDIKALKTVYSNKLGVADYYEWNDASYDDYGYFISLVPHTTKIKICEGDNIFGVIVPEAGFVGGQNQTTPRDSGYALVATTGLVEVRCESNVDEGDYVISNGRGEAEKSSIDCGYKVIDIDIKEGIRYAVISLGVQACTINSLGNDIDQLTERIGNAETNITAATNLANAAHNQASQSGSVSQEAIRTALEAMQKADGANSSFAETLRIIEQTNAVSVQAKAIAESAVTSAESIRNDAVQVANDALKDVNDLIEDLEPILTWEDPDSGNAGAEYFTTYIKDGVATKLEVQTVEKATEDNKSAISKSAESFQTLISSVDKYSVGEYSQAYGLTVEQAKSILKEGMIYIPTLKHSENSFADGEREFLLYAYYEWDGDKWVETPNSVSFSPIVPVGDAIKYWYIDSDNAPEEYEAYSLYTSIDGIWTKVNMLAGNVNNRITSMIRQEVDEVAIEVANARGSAASLNVRIADNETAVTSLASQIVGEYTTLDKWDVTNKDASKIYYVKEDAKYYYYKNGEWKSSEKSYEAGLKGTMATIEQKADKDGASIAQIVQGVGADGEVTAASIVTAINNQTGDSMVRIAANHIDLEGAITISSFDSDTANKLNNSVASTKIEFALSSESNNFVAVNGEDGQWKQVAPAWQDGKYMWQRTTVTYTNPSKEPTITMVCIQGAKGANGTGVAIKGTAYVKDITVDDDAIGNKYLLYIDEECTIQITSIEEGDAYLVNGYLFVYSSGNEFACSGKIQGPQGEPGRTPIKGVDYFDGISVMSIVAQYHLSNNKDTAPPQTNNSAITGWTDNFNTIWLNSSGYKYIWYREKVTYSVGDPSYTTPRVDNTSTVLASWCDSNDKTLIDGANIATGTISAQKITSDFVSALNLEVGNNVKMGENATISWTNVSDKDDVASKGDVSTAKNEAITAASNDATSKANTAESNAVSTIEGKGYQTEDQVTTISRNEISTATIYANQIDTAGLAAEYIEVKDDSNNTIFKADAGHKTTEIGGWVIDANAITKDAVGLSSGTKDYPSLVGQNASYVRIFAGGNLDFEGENRSQNETVSFTVYSKRAVSETINLPSDVARNYRISGARCATTSQTWSGSESNTITIGADEWNELYPEVYVCSKTLTGMYKSWANKSQGKVTYTVNEGSIEEAINISWSGSGILQMDFISLQKTNAKITVKCDYSYTENLNVSVSYTDTAATVQLTPKANVSSSDTLKYILDIVLDLEAKKPKFMVLEDGSLSASAANITGTIRATHGTFSGELQAPMGQIGGLTIQTNGFFSGDNDNPGLALKDNGSLSAQKMMASESMESSKIYVTKIISSADESLYLNLGTLTQETEKVNIEGYISEVIDEGSTHWWTGDITNTGKAKVIVTASKKLTSTRQIKCVVQYETYHAAPGYAEKAYYVTIEKGQDRGTMEVYNLLDTNKGAGSCVRVTPTVIEQETGELISQIVCKGAFIPEGSQEIGREKNRWQNGWFQNVYNSTGLIENSDENIKNSISILSQNDSYDKMYDLLTPVSYKFNNGTSGRTHTGLKAQNLKSAIESVGMTTKDMAAYCEWTDDDGNISCGIRYEELISLNIYQIQQLKKRVTELEAKIDELTKQND